MHSTLDQCLWTLSLLIRSSIPDFILKKYYSDVKQISPSFIGSSKHHAPRKWPSAGITWLPPKFTNVWTRGAITEAVFAKPKYQGPQQPPAKWWHSHRSIHPYQAPCPGTMPGWQPPAKAKVLHLASSQKTIAQHLRRNRGMRWGDDTFYTSKKN